MVKVKLVDNIKGIIDLPSKDIQKTFVQNTHKAITAGVDILKALKTEHEFQGVIPDGFTYEDYQLMMLENILTNGVTETELQVNFDLISSGQFGVGLNIERAVEGFGKLLIIYREIEDFVDNMIFLDTEDVWKMYKEVNAALGNITHGFLKTYEVFSAIKDIQVGEQEIQINASLYAQLIEEGKDLAEYLKYTDELLKEYKPVLELFESHPDLWESMLSSVDEQLATELIAYAEQVTLQDAIEFKEGTLVIDQTYIDVLYAREDAMTIG